LALGLLIHVLVVIELLGDFLACTPENLAKVSRNRHVLPAKHAISNTFSPSSSSSADPVHIVFSLSWKVIVDYDIQVLNI
jgi:hypothetical protein